MRQGSARRGRRRTRPGATAGALVAILLAPACLPGTARAAIGDDRGTARDPVAAPATVASGTLRVHVDCPDCDLSWLQSEATFASFVRDWGTADVLLVLSEQATGAGGIEYTLEFRGRGDFDGMNDTLRVTSRPAETDHDVQSRLSRLLRLGLARYMARLPAGERLAVVEDVPEGSDPAGERARGEDPWHGWVFSTRANGYLDASEGSRSLHASGAWSASRVSTRTKFRLGASGSYSENRYDYEDFRYASISRSRGFDAGWIFALGDHWSAALRGGGSTSTYGNVDRRASGGPAVEYSPFAYGDAIRRQLRVEYGVVFAWTEYVEPTLFGKTGERTAEEALGITLELREPWGSTRGSVDLSHYLHDFELNRVRAQFGTSLRVAEGLSLELGGTAIRIRDQISLPAGGATPEEILLERRQLRTDYSFSASLGFRYTFGSIFNRSVNARFGND